ncbi:hypothetical protein [Peribacillus asahii]|uniref:hypothetical protein n=1 Tax=Peribacillus asahii TaxID=228899 RepID=UPI00207A2B7D|nr:hypothetical protein [Peribacillus asahii]USK69217.1 hypothetical protein LIS76_16845 [Peribacillus asahii]
MEWIILSLFSLAIVLLLISFIKKDKVAKLEEELEQVTLTHMQDIFQLKKKVKILEEELLIQDEPKYRSTSVPYQPLSTTQPINEIIKSQVAALYRQGRSLEQIEKQSTLTKEQIIQVIEEQGLRGLEHE